jgi:hypothetical protein
MPETTAVALPFNSCHKDEIPVPLPSLRVTGLAAFLRELGVGESGIIPRRSSDDVYRMARTLGKTFTTRALDSERSRVWRTA